ncbi:unnamed protein product [Nippostrongylus brasiliensis]|uniref:POT1PC domain-containing protein n=1 Tax=Nippostrongylus brasiliensis TaxID=27835 RepID=A0A0N4XGB1_NIPBR|nr:unnamed protein product [Nippostrongylus brasiliensis]
MVKSASYEYTALQHLPDSGRDEDSSVLVKIAKDFQKPFQKVKMDDIIRIHRVEVGSCQGEPALILEVGAYGCHAVVWSGSSNVPTFVTSKNYTNTERSSNSPSDVDACDIPALGKNFFNWFGQVLGVYKAKGEPPTTVLRAWDGTEPVRCAAITREIMEPEGGGAEPHEGNTFVRRCNLQGVELPSAMNDAAAVASPTAHAKVDQSTPYTKPRKRSKSLKFAKNSLVEEMELDREPESSTTVKEHEENAENLDGVSHSEDELLESIHQQLAKEIRRILIDWEIERLIKEICEPRPVKSSLTEEMEEILKGNAGDSVHLTNPVEADIDGMKEAEYLRIAVIFTAVCTQCNHEMVVQRCTKNWCSKCYSGKPV